MEKGRPLMPAWEAAKAAEAGGLSYGHLMMLVKGHGTSRVYELVLTALAAAFAAGVKSRTSERVCAEGHAQDPLWSGCFICSAYDNGYAAAVQDMYERVKVSVDHIHAALRATGGGTNADVQ